jgi:hypothetical protein
MMQALQRRDAQQVECSSIVLWVLPRW